MTGVALGISFLWLFLLNQFSGVMVWITVILSNLAAIGISGFLLYNWYLMQADGSVYYTGNAKLDSQLYNEKTLLALGTRRKSTISPFIVKKIYLELKFSIYQREYFWNRCPHHSHNFYRRKKKNKISNPNYQGNQQVGLLLIISLCKIQLLLIPCICHG
jgi:hypothetical protein